MVEFPISKFIDCWIFQCLDCCIFWVSNLHILGVELGFLVSRLLQSRLGFLVCIISLKFGDVVSMHGYFNVFVDSLYAHSMPSLKVHSTPTKLS
jgi:hypothetical protein